MGLFQRVEGGTAIISVKGGYKQADLYSWDNALFASVGGWFVRLNEDGSTSKADMSLKHLSLDQPLFRDGLGKLWIKEAEGRRTLDTPKAQKLLGVGNDA